MGVHHCFGYHYCLGNYRSHFPLLGYVAISDQHRHDNYYFPDGVSNQRAQNKESLAVQLKLDEIVASLEGASNRLIDVEDLSEEEVENLRKHYQQLGKLLQNKEAGESHSVDETSSKPRRAGKSKAGSR